jgi:hypothetical protein
MVSPVNSHANATSRRKHLWEIDLRFAPGLPPGWERTLNYRQSVALLVSGFGCMVSGFGCMVSGFGNRDSGFGYLAHKKQPPPLGPPNGPRHIPTVGSEEGAVSFEHQRSPQLA